MMLKVILGSYLALEAAFDLKYREVLLLPAGIMGLAGILAACLSEGNRLLIRHFGLFMSMGLPLLPGAFLLLVSIFSRGKLGAGDAILVLSLGCWLTFEGVLEVLVLTFVMAGATAGLLLLLKKRKQEIPMAPFLFLAYLLAG